jgi:Polysulphide reductase, NrfD
VTRNQSSSNGHEHDGRYIDPSIGVLQGEASIQRVTTEQPGEGTSPFKVWDRPPAARGERAVDPTYYERPVLKEPVWIWSVPAYFYVGGVAGAASVLGAAAQTVDRVSLAGLIRRCRWIGAGGTLLGTGLLIYDLGRRERFLNMLRVIRPTSPMSLGSWALAMVGSFSGAASMLSLARGGPFRALGDAAGYGAGLGGLPLAGYTAVLLSTTAVPAWQEARESLPGLFIGSAASGAASLLELCSLNEWESRTVHRFGLAGKTAELLMMYLVQRDVMRIPRVGRPLRHGPAAALWSAARICAALSLLLSLLQGRSPRRRLAASILGTAASVGVRFAIYLLGKASARDPRATFRQQRSGHGAAEVTGMAAVAGPGGERASTPPYGPRA